MKRLIYFFSSLTHEKSPIEVFSLDYVEELESNEVLKMPMPSNLLLLTETTGEKPKPIGERSREKNAPILKHPPRTSQNQLYKDAAILRRGQILAKLRASVHIWNGLQIRESNIEGLGIFSTRMFSIGNIVLRYFFIFI